jgi:hypothetical protein
MKMIRRMNTRGTMGLMMAGFVAAAAVSVAFAQSAAPAASTTPAFAALKDFEGGAYETREVGQAWGARSLCVPKGEQLLFQGEQRPAGCTLSVIRDEPASAAVGYKCASGMTGRTDIRRDTEGLFVVDAQGISGGLPFARKAEFRRTGDCTQR